MTRFFQYYWLQTPDAYHPYNVRDLPDFSEDWIRSTEIVSLAHLKWGLYRLYVDALLVFGNVRTAFRSLRDCRLGDLQTLFSEKRFDTEAIERRGPPLPLRQIAKDSRYLISEMACKSYGDKGAPGDIQQALLESYAAYRAAGNPSPTVRQLLDTPPDAYRARQPEFQFSADEVLDEQINSEAELVTKISTIANKFSDARRSALDNTRYYLSMVSDLDLDVYVATSMRNRLDFRHMAETCERIFSDDRLQPLNLRYFDPTLSAANGHEDKGLIECLMVKCAKALVYCAGDRESLGKDFEAAMALSLGKPVIFYCNQTQRSRFYREVHPLSRLIEFKTGVAVGAMVTDRLEDVSELLYRTFKNRMIYRLVVQF